MKKKYKCNCCQDEGCTCCCECLDCCGTGLSLNGRGYCLFCSGQGWIKKKDLRKKRHDTNVAVIKSIFCS